MNDELDRAVSLRASAPRGPSRNSRRARHGAWFAACGVAAWLACALALARDAAAQNAAQHVAQRDAPRAESQAAPRAASLDALYRNGEHAVWTFESNGKPIGQHASQYLGRDTECGASAHHFHGSAILAVEQLDGVELRSSADLWTDDAGHPLRFVEQALVGDSYSRIELSVAQPRSSARVVQGEATRELDVVVKPDALLLANNYISHIEIACRLAVSDAAVTLPFFSGNSLQPFSYKLEPHGACELEVDGVMRDAQVYRDSLGEQLALVDGRVQRIDVAAQKLVIRRSSEPARPVSIVAPAVAKAAAEFDSTDVWIEHGDARIGGTLTKRRGASGRLPSVLFVSGSGAQDRNGYSNGLDLGTHEILDRLTRAGYLVLRVDDRSAGVSSALPPDATFDDLVADARACLVFLRGCESVDAQRIVLVGHSEGTETAAILAAEQPGVAAVVLLAAPGRSLVDVVLDQNRYALEEAGVAAADIAAELVELRKFFDELTSDAPMDVAALDADRRAAYERRAWFRSHARQDPIANVCKVRCPIWIAQGAKDFQVSSERDARVLERALEAAHHPDHALRVFAQLDHLFKRAPGEKSRLADYWKARPIDAEFLDALVEWLGARVAPGALAEPR